MNCREIKELMYSVEAEYILAEEEYKSAVRFDDALYEEEQLILAETRMNTFWDIYEACYWQIEEEIKHNYVYDLCDLGMDRHAYVMYCEDCGNTQK